MPAPVAAPAAPAELLNRRQAAALLGLSPYLTMKAASIGRIKAIAAPGEHPKYERASVERLAAELGKPVAKATSSK